MINEVLYLDMPVHDGNGVVHYDRTDLPLRVYVSDVVGLKNPFEIFLVVRRGRESKLLRKRPFIRQLGNVLVVVVQGYWVILESFKNLVFRLGEYPK